MGLPSDSWLLHCAADSPHVKHIEELARIARYEHCCRYCSEYSPSRSPPHESCVRLRIGCEVTAGRRFSDLTAFLSEGRHIHGFELGHRSGWLYAGADDGPSGWVSWDETPIVLAKPYRQEDDPGSDKYRPI